MTSDLARASHFPSPSTSTYELVIRRHLNDRKRTDALQLLPHDPSLISTKISSAGDQQALLPLTFDQARALLGDAFDPHQQVYDLTDRADLAQGVRQLQLHNQIITPSRMHRRRATDREVIQADATYDTLTQDRELPRIDRESFMHPLARQRLYEVPNARDGQHRTLTDRRLVETRQARALAGLDTSELDTGITQRVLNDPRAWGALGAELAVRGWVDDLEIARSNLRIEREVYPPYLWYNRRRTRRSGARLTFRAPAQG